MHPQHPQNPPAHPVPPTKPPAHPVAHPYPITKQYRSNRKTARLPATTTDQNTDQNPNTVTDRQTENLPDHLPDRQTDSQNTLKPQQNPKRPPAKRTTQKETNRTTPDPVNPILSPAEGLDTIQNQGLAKQPRTDPEAFTLTPETLQKFSEATNMTYTLDVNASEHTNLPHPTFHFTTLAQLMQVSTTN